MSTARKIESPVEIKKEEFKYPYFNTVLKTIPIRSGQAELIKLLNNGHDWSQVDEAYFLKMIQSRIARGKSFSIPSIAEIIKTYHYPDLKNHILLLIASVNPARFLSCVLFFKHLDKISLDALQSDEKIYLTRAFYMCLNHPCEPDEIQSFIEWSIHLKKKSGVSCFFYLYKKPLPHGEQAYLSYYIKICQLIIELPDIDSASLISKHFPNLKLLIHELETAALIEKHKQHAEEKIETILDRWLKIDDFVKFPLSTAEINQLKKDYAAMELEAKTVMTLSVTQFAQEAKKSAACLSNDPSQLYRLVAIVREAVAREFKNYPYPEQMLSVFALLKIPESLKGRVAKIRTGEGKSRTIAMLAALAALQNKCVDIITSNRYLAIRDQALFAHFYQSLGVTSSHICKNSPESRDFGQMINYATHHDIEFSILHDKTYLTQNRKITLNGKLVDRPFHHVLVDEVDVMLLDAQNHGARIAISSVESYAWVYPPIIQFLKTKIKEEKLSPEQIQTFKKQLFTPESVAEVKTILAKAAPHLDAEKKFSDLKIIKWLHAGIRALYELECDRDYTIKAIPRMTAKGEVKTPQIVIIDAKVTGRSSGDNCRWENGLHEMLELIHGLLLGQESLTCASISHFSLFERYLFIAGLTGTVGIDTEREELLQTYQVGSFDVPPRFPNRRIEEKPLYFISREAYESAIIEEIKKIKTAERPVLVIFTTIQETLHFEVLLKKTGIQVQLINEKQAESEEYLISRAGRPGVVTVATYTAGRGTDIILTLESLKNGGLHVIFGSFPNNERPEEQGFGRAGRQGQPGSCRMMVLESEPFVKQLLKHNPSEEITIEKLKLFRKYAVEQDSKRRRGFTKIDTLQHQVLQEFWSLLAYCQKELNDIDTKPLAKSCLQVSSEPVIKIVEEKTVIKEGQEIKEVYQVQEIAELSPLPDGLNHFTEQADLLLKQQFQGRAVDWVLFLNEFKKQLLDTVLKMWAKFYTSLADDDLIPPPLYEKILFKKFYQFIDDELGFIFYCPKQQLLLLLSAALKHNAYHIFIKETPFEITKFFKDWKKRIESIYSPISLSASFQGLIFFPIPFESEDSLQLEKRYQP